MLEDFSGHYPKIVDKKRLTVPKVAIKVGKCLGIMYSTVRDGRAENYLHEFKHKSRPILAASADGKQLLLLDGKYTFTERGIEDK